MLWKCKVIVPLLLLLLVCFISSAVADEFLAVKLGYQLLSPSGSIAGSLNGIGQKADLEKDLNLDDSEDITAEIAFNSGDFHLSFGYLPIEFSGTGTLSVPVVIGEQTFNIGTDVNSDLTIDLYDIGFTYYLINLDDLPTRFQLGLELAVKIADVEATLTESLGVLTATESVTAPIPTIGARARVALADFLGLVGRVGYLEYDSNHFVDAEAQLEFSPLPTVGIYAGYRYFDLKIDDSDLFIETDFSGPFGGAFVRF